MLRQNGFTKEQILDIFDSIEDKIQIDMNKPDGAYMPEHHLMEIKGTRNSITEEHITQSKTDNLEIGTTRKEEHKPAEHLSLTELSKAIEDEASKIVVSKSIPIPNEENWRDVVDLVRINPDQEYHEPPVCIEIMDGNESARLGTFCNFSAVIGKAKSKKTFLATLAMAAGLMEGTTLQDKIKVSLPEGKKKIALYDTEQSEHDVRIVMKRVYKLAGIEGRSNNLDVLAARALSPDRRLFLIEKYIYDNDDIGLLVIDGIRDLISDINSPTEATMITTKLLKWTQERNIHIIVVLHQNKDNNNARGHLGTEIVNKAESVISVEKDNLIGIVKVEFCRGKDFPPFAFSINNNLPGILPNWQGGADKAKGNKITYFTYSEETHLQVLREVFTKEKEYTYTKLWMAVKAEFKDIGIDVGDNTAKEFVLKYIDKFISKGKGKRYPVYTFKITQPV